MVLALVVVVEEIADQARILAEARSALLAVRLHLLTRVALRTDQLLQLLPVERVRFRVVVTEATAVNLPAARTLKKEQKMRFLTYAKQFFPKNKNQKFPRKKVLKTGLARNGISNDPIKVKFH